LIGTIGASFYLLGLGFVFIMTGSLNMADNARLLPYVYGQPPIIAGVILMVIGMGIKMALFPLHVWLPDAYTYAPSSSSALLAPIGTKVAAYVVLRILYFVFEADFVAHAIPLSDIILWTSLIGVIVGSVMAIAQNELKRMLAYSSIAQIGYIGVGIGLANPLGLIGAVLHVLNHAFMKASLFMVAGNLRTAVGHSEITRFDDTLRKSMPWTMAAFAVSALSMVGIPPMAGFFSKWYLVMAAIDKSAWVTLAVILLSSLLTAVYFFRVLEKVYLKPTIGTDVGNMGREVRFSMLLPPVALGFSLIVFGLINSVIVSGVLMKALPTGW
jgi:multicomponent Na+:H+ antiporter subunit D